SVMAWAMGNGDLHAKNLSVVGSADRTVAPIYDIPSTVPYGDMTFALPLAGRRDNLTAKAFREFGRRSACRGLRSNGSWRRCWRPQPTSLSRCGRAWCPLTHVDVGISCGSWSVGAGIWAPDAAAADDATPEGATGRTHRRTVT